ncbi:MAG: M20/M25/M40 family metallo-hydrolase [Oscillospiraceae bacterium]|nr:M20/M25/M40 family metallo-hydrolase [Oscillospiraceae bacterium]
MNEVPHVVGYEGELTKLLTGVFSKYTEVTEDKFGNLIAHKKGTGKGPKVMFMAHMDEIGMMTSVICDGGFVKFARLGGIDARNMLAQEVIIHGKEKVYGIIGIKPPHLTPPSEQKKTVELHDMVIDTGYSKEKLEKLIKPGDIITFKQELVELKNGKVACKALDDIAGVAAMYCAMKNLEHYNHDADIYFVASAQEEVGCRGGKTATYTIKPDIGIAIDVTFGRTAGLGEHESSEMGKGPALTIGPTISRRIFEDLKSTATKNKIPYQVDVAPSRTGTDADAILVTEGGVYTGVIGIPLKYMHSTVETLAISDVEMTGKLLSDYIISLQDSAKEGEECFWKN